MIAQRALLASIAFVCAATPSAVAAQTQLPTPLQHEARELKSRYEPAIRVIINLHADPFAGGNKFLIYNQWIANANWVLDELDLHGAKVSWGQVGEFGEFVVEGGPSGAGAALLRRAYQSGGAVQAHSHGEYHANTHSWPLIMPQGSFASAQTNWNDALTFTQQAVITALSPLSEPLESIVCLRGSHLPSNEPDFHTLMSSFGIPYRPAGPDEEFYKYFEHYSYHPHRPHPANALDELLSAPFVQLAHGSVVGIAQVHFNIFQDNTLAAMKAQFLLEFVNWRYRWKTAADDKVWCFGGGGHPSDYDPGDPSRAALPPLLAWLDTWFIGHTMPDGTLIASYSSERSVGEEFLAWERAHPGASSFRYPVTTQDYAWYPWLRPAHEELHRSHHVADLAAPAGARAFRLTNDLDQTIVLAWSDAGSVNLDLSSIFGAQTVTLRGLEHGASTTAAAQAVPVAQEALVIRL